MRSERSHASRGIEYSHLVSRSENQRLLRQTNESSASFVLIVVDPDLKLMGAGWSSKNNKLERGGALPDAIRPVGCGKGQSDFGGALIDQRGVGEAGVFGFADDDVVEDADAEDFARLDYARCAGLIIMAGRGISGGVIMQEYDRGRAVHDHTL